MGIIAQESRKTLLFQLVTSVLATSLMIGCSSSHDTDVKARYSNNGQRGNMLGGSAGGQKATTHTGFNVAPVAALSLVALKRAHQTWDTIQLGKDSKTLEKCQKDRLTNVTDPADSKKAVITVSATGCYDNWEEEQTLKVTYNLPVADAARVVQTVEASHLPNTGLRLYKKQGPNHNLTITNELITFTRDGATTNYAFTYESQLKTETTLSSGVNRSPSRVQSQREKRSGTAVINMTTLRMRGVLNAALNQWQITEFLTDVSMQGVGSRGIVQTQLRNVTEVLGGVEATKISPWMDVDACGTPVNGMISNAYQSRTTDNGRPDPASPYRPLRIEFNSNMNKRTIEVQLSGISFTHPKCETSLMNIQDTVLLVDDTIRRTPGTPPREKPSEAAAPAKKDEKNTVTAPSAGDKGNKVTPASNKGNSVTPPKK